MENDNKNKALITINGVQYETVDGNDCLQCAFDERCERAGINLCFILEVQDSIFREVEKKSS